MTGTNPWHDGERALQREAGIPDDLATRMGVAVRDHLRDQQRLFFPQLPFVLLGTVDADGAPWATLLAGAPGFLSVPNEHTIHVARAVPPDDPAELGLREESAAALLGIDMDARRRNRLNGTLRRVDGQGFDLAVEDSFGNCSRYIRPRRDPLVRRPGARSSSDDLSCMSDRLSAGAAALIAAADTFFVASYADLPDGRRQVDVSHRGGPAGFVAVSPDGMLTIPDYPGNNYYNTLGNLRLNGRAGLLFVDFATGGMLQITGRATIGAALPGPAAAIGAERSWTVQPERVVQRPGALPLRWQDA